MFGSQTKQVITAKYQYINIRMVNQDFVTTKSKYSCGFQMSNKDKKKHKKKFKNLYLTGSLSVLSGL